MPREIVTSENREEYNAKKMGLKKENKEHELTPSEYRKTQFNEEEHKYLPEDYFSEHKFNEKKDNDAKNLIKKDKNIEYRHGKHGGVNVFENEKHIGYGDNKSIIVHKEHQGKGIGVNLVSLLKEINPDHKFGSMTNAGQNLMYSYHKHKVKEAIKKKLSIPQKVKEAYPELFKK